MKRGVDRLSTLPFSSVHGCRLCQTDTSGSRIAYLRAAATGLTRPSLFFSLHAHICFHKNQKQKVADFIVSRPTPSVQTLKGIDLHTEGHVFIPLPDSKPLPRVFLTSHLTLDPVSSTKHWHPPSIAWTAPVAEQGSRPGPTLVV